MGKQGKDRFQKELAVRYCLAVGSIPFVEVITKSTSTLTQHVEVLTDLDVVGLETNADGSQTRTFFDCKSGSRMSAINRALWAAGVLAYTDYDRAHVILKKTPVLNHRLSALSIGVDLHDETSFRALGSVFDPAFPSDRYYQSSLTRWDALSDAYAKYGWSTRLRDIVGSDVPLTHDPARTFRRILSALKEVRGELDPGKSEHVGLFFDVLASVMVLWARIGGDIGRFYMPGMPKAEFESVLRFYMWGGRDAHKLMQQLRGVKDQKDANSFELPAWPALVKFAGLTVGAPTGSLAGAHAFREMALRAVSESAPDKDEELALRFRTNKRLLQFTLSTADYIVAACGLPMDFSKLATSQLAIA